MLACTGVMRVKPMLETASRIHSDRAGVRASQALDPACRGGFATFLVLPFDMIGEGAKEQTLAAQVALSPSYGRRPKKVSSRSGSKGDDRQKSTGVISSVIVQYEHDYD